MCILRIGNYSCGCYSVVTIIPCDSPSCTSVLNVGTLDPAYYIHIDDRQWANIATPCRNCRYEALSSEDPVNFRSSPEYLRLQLEGQMAFVYEIQELEADFRRWQASNPHRTHDENVAIAASLCIIRPEDLEADDRSCPICLEPFSDRTEEESQLEAPVRLNCRHVVGLGCIVRMLDERLTGCPLCRSRMDATPRSTRAEQNAWIPTVDYEDFIDFENEADDGYDSEADDRYESEGAWTAGPDPPQPRHRSM